MLFIIQHEIASLLIINYILIGSYKRLEFYYKLWWTKLKNKVYFKYKMIDG